VLVFTMAVATRKQGGFSCPLHNRVSRFVRIFAFLAHSQLTTLVFGRTAVGVC